MSQEATSRRAFLEALGRSAGAGAVLRAMTAMGITIGASACGSASGSDGASNTPGANTTSPPPGVPAPTNTSPVPVDWPAGVGDGMHVVILGAGIAGMTAAWEMNKLGYTCTLLEAVAMAGGRCRTIRAGDTVEETDSTQFCTFDDDPHLYFNPGPARIPHHHEFILGYCREFNIALEVFNNDNRAALLHSSSAFGGQPQLARRVLSDSRGHIAALLASAIDQGALDQNMSAGDRDTLRKMLTEFGDLTTSGAYNGSERAGFAGQEQAGDPQRDDPLPPLELNDLLNANFWQFQLDYSQSLNQQPTLLQPVGGMDRIARAFEARVGDSIIYEAEVTRIRSVDSGVEINFERNGSAELIQADYCICTLPATVLRSIDNNFSSAHRNVIASFNYSQSGKMAFQSRRFWEEEHNIYGGISWTDLDITQIWYPNSGLGREQGVIVGTYTFSEGPSRRFANQGPQQRSDSVKNQADELHPEFSRETAHGISVSWPKVPYQLGAWGTSDPGILRQADRQVYFAGEHLSTLQGWQEGAVLSAYHAVNAIVERDSTA